MVLVLVMSLTSFSFVLRLTGNHRLDAVTGRGCLVAVPELPLVNLTPSHRSGAFLWVDLAGVAEGSAPLVRMARVPVWHRESPPSAAVIIALAQPGSDHLNEK